MTAQEKAIHYCIGLLEGLAVGELKDNAKTIELGVKGIRELEEHCDAIEASSEQGIEQAKKQVKEFCYYEQRESGGKIVLYKILMVLNDNHVAVEKFDLTTMGLQHVNTYDELKEYFLHHCSDLLHQ